jgi:hypothetical protein
MDPANDWGDWVKADEALARITELEAELASVAERLSGRPALNDLPTTAAKVERLCAENQRLHDEAFKAKAELARLRPLAELYPLAWEECKAKRGSLTSINVAADAHDKARAERGVTNAM